MAENYLDQALLEAPNPCSDEMEFLKWRMRRRIGAVGLLWNRRSDAWLGINMTTEQREQIFAALEEAGEIVPVQVEGIRFPLYLLSEDRPLLDTVLAGEIDTKARLEFLAPLDPMLWDRKLIEALWDYRYSWEIYTPPAKRKYGYYVLPMLYGEDLIGRIEAVADRKSATMIVRGLWLEEGVKTGKKMMKAIEKAVERLAVFNGCEAIIWETK